MLAALCLPSYPAAATVIEFDRVGAESVQDAAIREASTRSVAPERPIYADLAYAVALRHAERVRFEAAGLTAPGFADLFVALIAQESRFDPDAVSPVGAIGLGQLMPVTARELKVADPFDPVQNLDASARYLGAQLRTFGSVPLALAAYNAGPGRVREHSGVPPYRETREYIAAILASAGSEDAPLRSATRNQQPSEVNHERDGVWEF